VAAASSLREALGEIAAEWARRTGRPPPRLRFDASPTLARQIAGGAPTDLFISAAPDWVEELHPIERADWLSNRLAIVVPADSGPLDLESLALADERVPVGRAARAALERLGIPLPARTILCSSARDVLAAVSHGGARAGVVYATDAAVAPDLRVERLLPAESHPKIVYTAALLTPAGRELYEALREPWALAIARRRGFLLP
jgi:molybdate transport system substrate-binding protein